MMQCARVAAPWASATTIASVYALTANVVPPGRFAQVAASAGASKSGIPADQARIPTRARINAPNVRPANTMGTLCKVAATTVQQVSSNRLTDRRYVASVRRVSINQSPATRRGVSSAPRVSINQSSATRRGVLSAPRVSINQSSAIRRDVSSAPRVSINPSSATRRDASIVAWVSINRSSAIRRGVSIAPRVSINPSSAIRRDALSAPWVSIN